jgi:hypothetical protein
VALTYPVTTGEVFLINFYKENDWWGADVPEFCRNPKSGHEKLIKEAAEIVIKNIRLLAIK